MAESLRGKDCPAIARPPLAPSRPLPLLPPSMSQNVPQWLDEIKSLQQQLADAHRERDEAYASALNWQKRYETEAQQRRVETTQAKQTIADLQQDVEHLKAQRRLTPDATGSAMIGTVEVAQIQAMVNDITTETALRSQLIQALAECDRLQRALETEQANHAQTRKSLTTALGDAIDAIAKEKPADG